jgi:mono/diheme cytochrome c family protein
MKVGRLLFSTALGCAALAAACTAPGGPDVIKEGFPGTSTPPDTMQVQKDLTCKPTTSAERLPARSSVVNAMGGGSAESVYFTRDLWTLFNTECGTCHVETGLGGFSASENTFASDITPIVMNAITTTDPNAKFMPPKESGGKLLSQRDPNDPVVLLASLLTTWIADGKPDSFPYTAAGSDGSQTGAGFALDTKLNGELTNIGSCVPGKDLVGMSDKTMDDMDAFFAGATDLPDFLDQTDLTTLDSYALAQQGVISYAPAYPLWSDAAGKMRYIRVPRGQSVKFDKATQTFQIPANTRFYKTFLKKVIDADGNATFRKIETRIIVSRPDRQQPDGTIQQTALYGTYVWNSDETQAALLKDQLRNGKPFKDRLISYVTDEPKAQTISDLHDADGNSAYYIEGEPGLLRHYALPGSERCVQCHMGSPSASFILGFTPLQVALLPMGQSGVIEPAMGDELTQLQRLISYGVVSGMTSPGDVLPLEQSEGDRKPRTPQELTAQAYMIGNCSHCHNPRGFPSTKAPALKNVLNFLPSTTGGIFEFPFESYSPVRNRGELTNVPVPYITPSLRDYPSDIYPTHDDGVLVKQFTCMQTDGCPEQTAPDLHWIAAPWRSLIYRNVDTPFDYVEDRVIFPHMPLNTPGYDCRAPQIMGEWMVSLPAVLKHPGLDEDARPYVHGDSNLPTFPADANDDPQPYLEVKPGDAGYAKAVAAAKDRLAEYHAGYRYTFCPDTNDILDSVIVDEVRNNRPVEPDTGIIIDPNDPTKIIMPDLGIPIHAHWVVTDDTDLPGDWYPRRIDWSQALVDHQVDTPTRYTPDDLADIQNVLAALTDTTLAQVQAEVRAVKPFGLWQKKDGCNFSGQKTVADFPGDQRPAWMDVMSPKPSLDAPVYQQSAGAAIFTSICFNCHGLQADSKGLLADEITLMTGGDARVANLRDGLFGPLENPGGNREMVFGMAAAGLGIGADDLAARYLAWMALGGTQKHLPTAILAQVSLAPVLGAFRGPRLQVEGTPDMLRLGLKLCQELAPGDENLPSFSIAKFLITGRMDWGSQTGVIDTNGDAEMWLRLCSLDNRPLVRVVDQVSSVDWEIFPYGLYWGDEYNDAQKTVKAYPDGTPTMDEHGNITAGLTADNHFPMCERPVAGVTAGPTVRTTGNAIPLCPSSLFVKDSSGKEIHALKSAGIGPAMRHLDARQWAARGAINAAMAVFTYLDDIEHGKPVTQPLYSECEKLGTK